MAAATIHIRVKYGASTEEGSDAADLNLLGADLGSGQSTAAYPITVPAAGTNYSYERKFRLKVENIGDSSRIQNIRVYSSTATPSTGCTIKYGQQAAYTTPVNTASAVATTAIPTSLPGSENLYIGGAGGGYLSSSGTYSDYGVMQLNVGTTAISGGTATITIAYDEVA